MKTNIAMTMLGIVSLLLIIAPATQGASMQALIEQLPAGNFELEKSVAADLVKSGPDGLQKLCQKLVPPGTGDDTQVRLALNAVTMYVSEAGNESDRLTYVAALLQTLNAGTDKEVQAFLIRQLQLAGKAESIKPLSGFLSDQRLCEPAAQALVRIGGDQAGAALARALPNATENVTIAVVRSLGALRYAPAAEALVPYTNSKDPDLQLAALWSVANIGHSSAQQPLSSACSIGSSYRRAKAHAYYLLYAQRLMETQTQRKNGIKICRILVRSNTTPANIRSSALGVIVDVLGARALDALLRAVDIEDAQVQAAALSFAHKIPGTEATAKWVNKAKQAPASTKVQILGMLGRRNDPTALPALVSALKDDDVSVRIAAIVATVDLAQEKAADQLLPAMKRADTDEEVKAFQSALSRLGGSETLSAIADAMGDMPAKPRIALIEILEERQARPYSRLVIAQTKDEDQAVRKAALQALDNVARASDLPVLIELLLQARKGSDVTAARKAVIAAARQMDDPNKATTGLLTALGEGNKATRIPILKTLPGIGGSTALNSTIKATQDSDASIQDAAIRGLADWPDTAAIAGLFKIAKNAEKLTHQVLAIRACTRLISAADWPAAKKVQMLQQTLDAAQRVEEKKAVLASAANLRTVDSLIFVSTCLYQEDLNSEAALAVAKIACPQRRGDKGMGGDLVAVMLKRSLEKKKILDEKIKKRIEDHLANMPAVQASDAIPPMQVPEGFVPLFNGKNLLGWKGLLLSPYDNPAKRKKLSPEELKKRQAEADEDMRKHWFVDNGVLCFDGTGHSLATTRDYGDFEMLVDWKLLTPNGDSGLYLRGSPQVQIWDPAHWKIGSGGLYNNKKNPSKPTMIADNPIGQWNTFRIKMTGERVTVHLNGKLIVDDVVLENYWDRNSPIFPLEQIELQCHGDPICFRNIFIKAGEFRPLFNGKDLSGWIGDTKGYIVQDEKILCKPGGNLYTAEEFADFHYSFDFKLTPGANNGLGIRTPSKGDAAYAGMELQILDNTADKYKNLRPYQYHGSIYGVAPALRGFLKPLGEWNHQEVIAHGPYIQVVLNKQLIVAADINAESRGGTMDNRQHPGMKNPKGHIGFLGHGSVLEFRNIGIKEEF
jgi:HEAT repeat protein